MSNTAVTLTTDPWVPSDTDFGTRLAMVRQRKGWNLTEASLKSGLGQNDWARYEQGAAPRKLVDVVTKIANATGVDQNWLMWGPSAPPRGGNSGRLYGLSARRTLTGEAHEPPHPAVKYRRSDNVTHITATTAHTPDRDRPAEVIPFPVGA